jgi:hypothetical protein
MVRSAAKKVMWVGRATVFLVGLAVILALVFGVASRALAGSGVNGVFNLGVTNAVDAITTLVGSVAGPSVRIDNNSTNSAATALDLRVEPGKTPMKVNSGTKVTNLNADRIDSKSAEQLSRVGLMRTSAPMPLTTTMQIYGDKLSITAPAAGFVRVSGNVTVLNGSSGCTSGCMYAAFIHHAEAGGFSDNSEAAVPPDPAGTSFDNLSLDHVFPVNAGVNTFYIRLSRSSGNGVLHGWRGTLTGEYTPYGSTGTGTL